MKTALFLFSGKFQSFSCVLYIQCRMKGLKKTNKFREKLLSIGASWLTVIFCTLFVLLFFIYTFYNKSKDLQKIQLEEWVSEEIQKENEVQTLDSSVVEELYVDIKGAVKFPGVYQIKEGRVIDAIELAGGFSIEADSDQLNLAQKLSDQMVILVPEQGQDVGILSLKDGETLEEVRVNINSADKEELQTLTGIGPGKAAGILAYREENGSFQSIEELKNVSGIGEKTFEKLKEQIMTGYE